MNAVAPEEGVYALLTDGTTVLIRQAGPQDEDAVRQMHAQMSPANTYLRFFSISSLSASREAKRVSRPPDLRHYALLAWLGNQLVGVASYEPTDKPGIAEIAFAVSDHMHGRGVATLLLDHLISEARLRGVRAFTAQTLADNAAMLRVFANAGLAAKRQMSGGVIETTFPLPADEADRELHSYLDSVAMRARFADVASLRHLLEPASVAVIGASRKPGRVGHAILRNMIGAGFRGGLYAVNPHATSVFGVPAVPSVADLPEPPDLAVLAVPPAQVTTVAEECGKRGAKALVVVTAQIDTETGSQLLAACRRGGMRLVGPNCFGVAVPSIGLNATFTGTQPTSGSAGLVMQSGGIGIAVLDHLTRLGIGVSSFASVGDKYDVSSNDMLMWWEQDGSTKLAVLYVESFGSPRRFAQTARRVGRQFPVLTVIAGRSAAGQRAATSHTAAAATRLITQEALFEQAGVIATTGLGELIDTAALFASQPVPAGSRVAIVSNAGGAGVLAADACGDNNLKVAVLSETTQRRLRKLLPSGAVVTGPVDTSAAVSRRAFRSCLERVARDDGVDSVMAITVPTALGRLTPAIIDTQIAKPIVAVTLDQQESVRLLRPRAKPALQTQTGAAGDQADAAAEGGECPVREAIPSYLFPESAARALGHAVRYGTWCSSQEGQVPELEGIKPDDARRLVADFLAKEHGGGWLPPDKAATLLGCYGIELVRTIAAASADDVVRAASDLGGAVVVKADVEGLVHKTDAGAVLLDLRTETDVRRGYDQLVRRFGPGLRQVLVQPMLAEGVEVLIGVAHEPVFGPLVVFGLGGVTADVLGDHAARLTPLTDVDAREMIGGIRAAPLLYGHHGGPPVDLDSLADILLRISRLADEVPEIAELDLNPVMAQADGAHPVDARIRLVPTEPQDPFLRRLR
ncbi:MAG TPA: GNAT family N-acetyltransferase [Streptosporangiaceae bacterium]|jgi:acyl-CoA synthetase (NDP forming)/GNAT superfamily N-acetyltransferase|nr:GNAT family N-acetyltransferase [Streptosporangiaceae bacterium]